MAEMNFNEWYEPTPADWSIQRMKNIMVPREERSAHGEEELLSVTIHGGVIKRSEYIDEDDETSRADSLVGYKIVSPTNLVNNIMKMSFRCLGVSAHEGIVSPAYSVFELNQSKVDHSYLNFLLRIDRYVAEYRKLSKGIQESRMRLYDDFFLAMKVIVPPLDEQKRISHYLDKKTSLIDSLINKIEKKIKLLKEQRTSLINQYVTKGLNPNVEMKDSGVEWIGEIPKHWNVSKFKFYFEFGMGQTILKENLTDDGYPVLSATEKYELLGYFDSPSFILEVDDLVIPARGNSIGFVKLVREPSVSTQTTIYGKRKFPVSSNFVRCFCEVYKPYLFHFDQTAIPQITVDQVKNNILLIPPKEEQITISNELDKRCDALELLVNKLQKRKDLMNEYRQSLISSVVTGKVRVTEDMV